MDRTCKVTPEELRQARQAFHMTQVEAAELFGISLCGYKAWEQGRKRPYYGHYPQSVRLFVKAADSLPSVADMERAAAHFKRHKLGDKFIEFARRAVQSVV